MKNIFDKMSQEKQVTQIQLECSSILQVPLQSYINDFTFIVNGKEFKTSKIISDLLSPKISQIHSTDPTFDEFTINTKEQGDFSHILQLVNFRSNKISDDEICFYTEVLDILKNCSIIIEDNKIVELTKDNIISELRKHEIHSKYYSKKYREEIEFASKNLSEILKEQENDMKKLKKETLEDIINNENLTIDSEDELLHFVNELYKSDSSYANLYECIYFNNVSLEMINEFIQNFDLDDMTTGTWIRICERLGGQETTRKGYKKPKVKGKIFEPSESDPFSGIFNFLRTQTNKIENEIEITASSIWEEDNERRQPRTVALKENPGNLFYSKNVAGSWLMVDFKEYRIIPTDYTIRSYNSGPGWHHPKSWVIEVSNDKNSWEIIDEVNNCSYLNGKRLVHTFKIQKRQSNEIRYMRIRQTADWYNANILGFETLEIYGTLIENSSK